MSASLFDPLQMAHGPALRNRFMLAPLTNWQSNADGTLGDDEYHWLTRRAQGGFGLTMTCAAHVQRCGHGFPGQLGIWSDAHLPGLERLAAGIHAAGSRSSVQLQHSGRRAAAALIGEAPRSPWPDADSGAHVLSTAEVERLVEDFILAGLRAERAGFDGIELHAAHGYLLCQFLDADHNHRDDRYGGSFENRRRMLFDLLHGLRARSGADFQIGVRLSPERFGITIAECRQLVSLLIASGTVDYIDLSMWDVFKPANEKQYGDTPLIDLFGDIERGGVRIGAAGKIMDGTTAQACLDHGMDYVLIGRGAILHHDFPQQVKANPAFEPVARPVTRDYLRNESVGPAFIDYIASNWKDFVVP